MLEATVEGLEDQNASTIVKIAELEAARKKLGDKRCLRFDGRASLVKFFGG